MLKINKKVIAGASLVAAAGTGTTIAEKTGAFDDSRFNIDNSTAVNRQLEASIKPELQKLGGLTLSLLKESHHQGLQEESPQTYDPNTDTVTISANGKDAQLGTSIITVIFGAQPGTHQPDAADVRYFKAEQVQENQGPITTTSIELAAPGETSLGTDITPSVTQMYSASESGGIDNMADPSQNGTYLLNTRDNTEFTTSAYNHYPHNPVPTAKQIVADARAEAPDIIRSALEQPLG